jgi:ferric enterobactin receptor
MRLCRIAITTTCKVMDITKNCSPLFITLISCLFSCVVEKATAQDQPLTSVRLNGYYEGSFTDVLNRISREQNVRFIFEKEKLDKHKIQDFMENKLLTDFLDYWCLLFDLKYEVASNGILKIKDLETIKKEEDKLKKIEEARKINYSGPATSLNISVSGKLTDIATGETLPFGSVIVKGTRYGTSTNVDGLFTLQNVPSDTSTLMVSYTGYTVAYLKLNPFLNRQSLEIKLQAYDQLLEEIKVTAQREDVLKANENISTIRMNPQSLSKMPNLGERDIMRAFQLMPGISAANESSSGLYIRGGTPDQNLIVYDGFTIYHVDHLYGFFSAFNANAVKDVRLYKGGYESRFGGRLSSVMEITGKDGNANKFSAGGSLSLLSINGYIETPVGKKITTLFAFRRSWKGPLYKKIFNLYNSNNTNTNQSNQGPNGGFGPNSGGGPDFTNTVKSYFYDLNGKITFRPTQNDVLSLSVFNGTDDLNNSQELSGGGFSGFGGQAVNFNSTTSDVTTYGNAGLSLKWSRQWTKKLYSYTLLSQSQYFSDRNRSTESSSSFQGPQGGGGQAFGGIIENNNLLDKSAQINLTHQTSGNLELSGGLFFTQYDITYSYGTNDTTTLIDRKNNGNLMGTYVQGKIKLLDQQLLLTPGLRVSSFEPTDNVYYEPRLSVQYNLTERIKITAASGQYYQFANRVIREDILAGSRDFWVLSDGNSVKVSESAHFIAGLNYETRSKLFSIEAYRKNYTNLSEYTLRFESDLRSGTNYNENFYTGIGYAQGVEFLAQQKVGKLQGWVSYTLAEVRNKFDAYGTSYYPAAQDVRHELKFVSLYNVKRWDFSVTYIYATGRPYTAPLGGYQLTLLDGSTRDYVAVGAKNAFRLPYYERVDASISFELRNKKGNNIGNIAASVFNILNRKNVWYKEFQISEGNVVETDINYLGITPNVSVTLNF